MSKKNLFLIILISIFLIGILVFFYFFNNINKISIDLSKNESDFFGNTSANKTFATTSTQTTENDQTSDIIKNRAKLLQIYKNPTSGSIFLINKDKQNILRFVDRAIGNVYEYAPENQNGEVQRITNTTIPKIQETVWSNFGDNLILRYLDENTDNIISFSAKIKNISTSSADSLREITGTFLSPNLKQLIINPKGDKIFGLIDKSDKSGTYGFTTNLDGSGKKIIFISPISYWNISWPKENIITFTTKPNYKDIGLLYFFNTQTNSMDRILGNIIGLSTLTNKDTSLTAYSYSINNSFLLDIYDVKNKISINWQIPTLAEKCIWGNNTKILYCAIPQTIIADKYPDVWYQGLVSFKDNIWKMNIEYGSMEKISQIDSDIDIDAFNLKISLDDKYLAFSNKNDLSLWLLEL
ncbi:MAG: hypothetical protein V1910_02570 [bacterium]